VVNFKVVPSRLVEGWYAAGVAFSLRAKCQPIDVFDIRQRLDLFRRFEVMLKASHRLDRDRPSGHCADLFCPGAGSIDDRVSSYGLPGFEPNCSKPPLLDVQPDDFIIDELGTKRPRFLSQALQHPIGVEPTVIGRKDAGTEVVYVH